MNNIKILYFNIETIDGSAIEASLRNCAEYVSHIVIKQGLFLVNYNGSARDLFDKVADIAMENTILIYDLEKSKDAYWGYMNKSVWDWIQSNGNDTSHPLTTK